MITKGDLIKNIEFDINYNINLQNTIKKPSNLPIELIIGIITTLATLGISFLIASIYWVVSSYLMWGIYTVYSLIASVIYKVKKTKIEHNKISDKKIINFYEKIKPFQEAVGLFFLISIIILGFIDISYKTPLIIIAFFYCFGTIILLFPSKIGTKGFKEIFSMQQPSNYLIKKVKGEKRLFSNFILLFLFFILIVLALYIIPFYLLYAPIKLIGIFNLNFKLILILMAFQFFTLYLFVGYLSTSNTLKKLKKQLFKFKEIKDNINKSEKISKEKLHKLYKEYSKEKKLQVLMTTFLKIEIWISFYKN